MCAFCFCAIRYLLCLNRGDCCAIRTIVRCAAIRSASQLNLVSRLRILRNWFRCFAIACFTFCGRGLAASHWSDTSGHRHLRHSSFLIAKISGQKCSIVYKYHQRLSTVSDVVHKCHFQIFENTCE